MYKISRVKSDNDLISVSLERSLGCARGDDTGKGYPKKFEGRDEWLVTSDW